MTVDAMTLRAAMRAWATGVTVVTSADGDTPHGMAVSSFTSLSLEPPLVLVSLEKISRTHALVARSGVFGVTILSEDQEEVSNRFANPRTEPGYRFSNLATHTLLTGAPVLSEGLAFFDCRVVATHEAGTHTVFIGEVVAAKRGKPGQPLLYFNQGYRKLAGG